MTNYKTPEMRAYYRRYRQLNYQRIRMREIRNEKRRCRNGDKKLTDSKRDPFKLRAKRALNKAIFMGKIKKPTKCQECGWEPGLIHGHHEDYSKPYDVIWLCRLCHGKRHRKDGGIA
jgi:hypothetical protein